MGRYTDPQLDALIVSCATETTIDIRLRGASQPYLLSTRRKLFIERGDYVPLINRTREQKLFEDAEANQMTVELSNIDGVWGDKVVSSMRPLEGARVSVRRYYEHPDDPLVYRHEPFFGGIMVRPEANEEEVSFDVILKTSHAGIVAATKTLEQVRVPGTVVQSPPGSPGNPTSGGAGGGIGTVGGGTGGGCFIAGTPVLTPHGWRPIESIKKNQKVLSFDERTREIITDTVARTFRHVVTGYLNLRFSDGGILQVTGEHRFLTESGVWKHAFNLRYGKNGDRIWRLVGRRWTLVRLEGVRYSDRSIFDVFNMHVLRNQTYIADGFAAHNTKDFPREYEYPQNNY